jgi:hypothetical protein
MAVLLIDLRHPDLESVAPLNDVGRLFLFDL